MTGDQQRLESATAGLEAPFAVVDLDAFDANAADLLRRAGSTPVRLASKSVRCRALIDRALDAGLRGILAFTLPEALWLAEHGAGDLVVAYPTVDRSALRALAAGPNERVTVMADCVEHLDMAAQAVRDAGGGPLRVCLDIDAGWWPLRGRIRVGARRSPIRTPEQATALARTVLERDGLLLDGLMSYEAHIAGVGDRPPGRPLQGAAIRLMQRASARELAPRRAAVAAAVGELAPLRFVNGGGTGSVQSTAAEPAVTEVTAGSGLYGPTLFDAYSSFAPRPAAWFALPVVRRPDPQTATALGGGYLASGPATADRLPRPVLPAGLRLDGREGAGEVQTPLRGAGAAGLRIGDRVWMRHAKAGELCERFDRLHLIAGDEIVDVVPTYRGEGGDLPVTDRTAEVQAWLDGRADEMASLLETLVRIPTENPPGRELARCAGVLRDVMERMGFSSDLIELAPTGTLEGPTIVRGGVGSGGTLIYFHGHFDVVPAQSPSQFEPERRDGRIVGRGSADMKGGLVSMLYGAAAATELGLLDGRKIVFHFVCDEETGSAAGSGHLREAELIDPEATAMLTAEPSGGVIWHACRGAITLRVRTYGREAHVGYVHQGINAFEHMIRIAQPLATLSHELLEKRTSFPVESEEAGGSMLVVGGQAGAGAGFNAVPGSAWFSIDRRFNPEEELDQELERLTGMITEAADAAGAKVDIDVPQQQPSGSTDQAHPAAQTLARCIGAVEGAAPTFQLCPGVLDTRWYSQLGIPAFAYGGGRLEISHGPDEYIDEAAMRRCAAVYALFAARL